MAIELPEAITLSRQMDEHLRGKRIVAARLSPACASLIRQGFINLHEVDLSNRLVEAVTSKGKWSYIRLQPALYLLLALETGGKILYHSSREGLPEKFHLRIEFGDGSYLTEQIVGWGWAKAVEEEELELQRYPGKLGISPLDEEFTPVKFNQILAQSGKKNIKAVLIDQQKIAGIGNGYLQDILYQARIHPARKAAEISAQERAGLHRAIQEVLSEALQLGGCQFETDLYGRPGGYQRRMGGHLKGQPCPACGTAIEKVSVQGSAMYICSTCQK